MSRQALPFLSLSLLSTCTRILRLNSRMIICILARRHVTPSFGLDDILLTAASDSEDFGPVLEDALPHSGQEARPSTAYSELVAFHVPLRSSHWIGPMSPASLKHRNSTSGSLAARTPGLKGGSCHFSAICIKRSPDPGSTLRVYVAAIAAWRKLDEVPLGRHRMVSSFMSGVRRLRPARPMAVPSWDLSVVLEGLVAATFEPLESAPERILTLKVTLLLALTSLKRVGDLQALSISEMCMDFAPGLVKVTLRPRPGYIPKVFSTSFHSQVVTLHSFHPPPFASSEDENLHMLCPVRALKLYVDRSKV